MGLSADITPRLIEIKNYILANKLLVVVTIVAVLGLYLAWQHMSQVQAQDNGCRAACEGMVGPNTHFDVNACIQYCEM